MKIGNLILMLLSVPAVLLVYAQEFSAFMDESLDSLFDLFSGDDHWPPGGGAA